MRPDARNTACSPALDVPARRNVRLRPRASGIWLATVRIQISSYNDCSSRLSSPRTCSGVRNRAPAGRMASWASWAFFTLLAYVRGAGGRYAWPNRSTIWARAASTACSESFTESVRM